MTNDRWRIDRYSQGTGPNYSEMWRAVNPETLRVLTAETKTDLKKLISDTDIREAVKIGCDGCCHAPATGNPA
jgi:hypothetical protein